MLATLIGLTLLLQAYTIAGQDYQVYGAPGLQVIYPSSSQVQVLDGRHFFRNGFQRNFTISANATSQDFQLVSNLSNGNSGNTPLRNFLRSLFGRQPNVQFVNLNSRAFNDVSQEPQYRNAYRSFATPVVLPGTRVKAMRQGVPRRILVRNLLTTQSQTTNLQSYRIPVFENDLLYNPAYVKY
ncbi:uncharacterized protein LOC26527031 [Drosophila erecta]|uniref:Uncharacterized protein n=1 Tax=Drosophila erecta TaxID=7220 RepID=A0A0Q5VML3_DROER|nr:uncharacterized protein LOC26527031 [Drosophila erecta]KQS62236.1 uncharacterized protein Dere_GG27207 [Drosophila erecta]